MMGSSYMMVVRNIFRITIILCLISLSSCEGHEYCDNKIAERKAIQYVDSTFRPDTSKVFKHSIDEYHSSMKFTFENKEPSIGGAIVVIMRKSDCTVQDVKITQ